MQKNGIKNFEQILDEEISKFIQGERLTEQDLKRLDVKIKKLLHEKSSQNRLKEKLTQSLQGKPSDDVLPKIEDRNLTDNNTISAMKQKPNILNTEVNTLNQKDFSSSLYRPMNAISSQFRYKKPEEELAELEAELGKEETTNKKI